MNFELNKLLQKGAKAPIYLFFVMYISNQLSEAIIIKWPYFIDFINKFDITYFLSLIGVSELNVNTLPNIIAFFIITIASMAINYWKRVIWPIFKIKVWKNK